MLNSILLFLRSYFHRPSQYSIEVTRIVMGVCSLLIFHVRKLVISGEQVYADWNIANYYPKGILALLYPEFPLKEIINVWLFFQCLTALFLILGFLSRLSLLVNFFCNLFLISLTESFTIPWSHGFNLNLLAQMPFIFAPVGRCFSLDAWIQKKFFRKNTIPYSYNALHVWMVNFGIVTLFLNAFFWKLLTDRTSISLKWAWSENFRNQILFRYPYSGEDIPSYLNFIVESEWNTKIIALLNLLFQFLPFLSLFFLHRPWIRLLLGLTFVMEEIGLSVVMQLPDWHWIPLILTFVDWDYFFKVKPDVPYLNKLTVRDKLLNVYFFLYVYAYISLAFNFYLPFGYYANGGGINSYPFSTFGMYSTLYIKNEFGKCRLLGYDWDFSCSACDTNAIRDAYKKYKKKYYGFYLHRDSTEIKNDLIYLRKILKEEYQITADCVVTKRVLYEFPDFSEVPEMKKYMEMLSGVWKKGNYYFAYPVIRKTKDSVAIVPLIYGFTKPRIIRYLLYNYKKRKVYVIDSHHSVISSSSGYLEGNRVLIMAEIEENGVRYRFGGVREDL